MTRNEFDQVIEQLRPRLSLQVRQRGDFGLILKDYRFGEDNDRFGLRVHTSDQEGEIGTWFRFYLFGFNPKAPRGPWLNHYYQSWCNTDQEFRNWRMNIDGNAFTGRLLLEGKTANPNRHDEGGLLEIRCPVIDLQLFGNWLVHLFRFSDSIVNEWNREENGERIGPRWNTENWALEVQPYLDRIYLHPAQETPNHPEPHAQNNPLRPINNEIRQLLESNRQVILFGAPGTGKSFALKSDYEGGNAPFRNCHARVTFYPTYSYSQFVGTYKPVMKQVGPESKIAYEFVPGPLLRMLVRAANDPDKDHNKYLLIIEEINRANAAAVFGDFFQLLDRDSDGRSEYPIAAGRDVVRYLAGTDDDGNPILNDTGRQFFGMDGFSCTLSFPKNLYLHATMNSADQGVFPMDTAFKRRWAFGYVGIDEGQRKCEDENWTIGETNYRWNDVRKLVNRLLSLRGVNEDKLMGPFFVKPETGGTTVSSNQFKSKVLMYLWEDAARMCRRTIFGSDIKTYSELLDAWNASGVNLFNAGDANLGDQGDANARALYRRIVNPTQEIPPPEPPADVAPEPPEPDVVTPGGATG